LRARGSAGSLVMRAIRVDGGMDPAALRVAEVPEPVPGPDDVLVEVYAAAVNRSDVLSVRGAPISTYPRIPGRDFAGRIVAGPAELLRREVWGCGGDDLGFRRDGSHAQFLAIPRDAVVVKPSAWALEEAGGAGLAYTVAALALDRAGGVTPGATVLVTGVTGGVGTATAAGPLPGRTRHRSSAWRHQPAARSGGRARCRGRHRARRRR